MTHKLPLAILAASLCFGAARAEAPPDPNLFAYSQNLGARLPLDARFVDQTGAETRLGDVARGAPIVLALGYYKCPNLCGLVRDDLFRALASAGLREGRDVTIVQVSIDPDETDADARSAETADISAYGLDAPNRGRLYLTGAPQDVQALADAVGFRDRLDADTRQFVHPAGLVVASADGVVSNYLLGVGYAGEDLRRAVEGARAGVVAKAGLPILLLCFHFDPTTGRYTLEVMRAMRLAALLAVVLLGGGLVAMFLRDRRRQ